MVMPPQPTPTSSSHHSASPSTYQPLPLPPQTFSLMHKQLPYIPNVTIPYSRWSQHRAENGLIYLSHPQTGEVKWLWSRHHDPVSSHDYLVNTITGKRQWVTSENEHLCPIHPLTEQLPAPVENNVHAARSRKKNDATRPLTSAPTSSITKSRPPPVVQTPHPTNPFSDMPKPPPKARTDLKAQATRPQTHAYREMQPPKSLALAPDEVLMVVPESGRRYIYNKTTRTSRWLPERDGSPASVPTTGKGRRSSRPASSPDSVITPHGANNVSVGEGLAAAVQKASITSPTRPNSFPSTAHHTPNLQPKQPDIVSQNGSAPTTAHPSPALNATRRSSNPSHIPSGRSRIPKSDTYTTNDAALDIQRCLRAYIVRKADVAGKMALLNTILTEIEQLTGSGKYEMNYLRKLVDASFSKEERVDGAQRLLELGEYLTQKMLKVDLVESAGNQIVRAKRKQTVKMILSLTDEIDELRKQLNAM